MDLSNGAQRSIIIMMVALMIVTMIENAVEPKPAVPNIGIILGTFVAGAILLMFSYFVPNFAVGLAAIALVATIFTRGRVFWDAISRVTGTAGTTATGATNNTMLLSSPVASPPAPTPAQGQAQTLLPTQQGSIIPQAAPAPSGFFSNFLNSIGQIFGF